MPRTTGLVNTDDNGNLTATFRDVDGFIYLYNGTLTAPAPGFAAIGTELEYPDIDDLSGAQPFDGTVGPGDLSLKIGDSPQLSGHIYIPHEMQCQLHLSGSGKWTKQAPEIYIPDD